jgi:DEAD/DEAH box helicase domain-containing protein
LIGGVLDEFRSALQSWREDYENLLAAWRETQNKPQANAIRYQLSSFYELTVIEALADRQFLPHYGFPIGVQKLRIITPDPDKRFHGRIREEDQYRLERSSLLALREYVPGSQLLVGGKLIASRGLLKHWTGATIDRSLGLRGKFTHCKNDHFHYWYDIGADIPNCPICEAPPRENAWDLLIPKYGFTTAAWDPPRWSTDVERVGTTEIATITFSERSSGGTTFDVADLGGIDGLSVRYREDGELLVYNRGESGHGFAICLKCGYSQSESKHGQGAIGLPTGFDHHASVTSASQWEDCWSKGGEVALRNQVLAARETTDVVLLDFAGCLGVSANYPVLMTTIAYALQRAGARLLELDARELGVMTVPAGPRGQSWGCVLFDTTPGGAGHVRELLSLRRSWLLAAREAIFVNNEHDNHCETACLECLLSFDAQEAMAANLLHRRIAMKALDDLLSGPMQNRGVNDNPNLHPTPQASDTSKKRITRARELMQQRRQ